MNVCSIRLCVLFRYLEYGRSGVEFDFREGFRGLGLGSRGIGPPIPLSAKL